MMGRTKERSVREGLRIVAATLAIILSTTVAYGESPVAASSPVPAPQPSSATPGSPPATRIVPSDESEAPAAAPSEAGAASAPTTTTAKPRKRKVTAAAPPEVEPAAARLRVTEQGWIYAAPAKSSKKLEKASVGKFVDVTGSTRYYLQAKLKDGQTGYISPSNVELVKPTDKIFLLSQDAAVLDAPNRWSKKLATVHRGHNVQVVGIALNYLRIRMKSGLTGFIPVTAVQ